MRLLIPTLFVSVIAALSGCDVVVIERPLGEAPYVLDAEKVDGAWYVVKGNEQPFFVQVQKNGQLILAGVEQDEAGFSLEQIEVHLMQIGEELYFSGPSDEESIPGYYFAWVAKREDSEIILVPPNIDTFSDAVTTGELPGTVTQGEYATIVKVAHENVLAFIRKTPADELWDRKESIVVRKFSQGHVQTPINN